MKKHKKFKKHTVNSHITRGDFSSRAFLLREIRGRAHKILRREENLETQNDSKHIMALAEELM